MFESMSLKELREFVAANGIVVEGDRRRKATYIAAVNAWQALREAKSEVHTAVAPAKLKAEVALTSPAVIKAVVATWNAAWQVLELLLLGLVVAFWLGRRFGEFYADVIKPAVPRLYRTVYGYYLGRHVVSGSAEGGTDDTTLLRAQLE